LFDFSLCLWKVAGIEEIKAFALLVLHPSPLFDCLDLLATSVLSSVNIGNVCKLVTLAHLSHIVGSNVKDRLSKWLPYYEYSRHQILGSYVDEPQSPQSWAKEKSTGFEIVLCDNCACFWSRRLVPYLDR